jgi:outer membrane protein assembly factor BamB
METAERRTVSSADAAYDGFISYSHAADDLLAPRLQSGLQRFAKPWWKRRALRIFRDQSSLSANPHLWSSITQALDQSGWFVLLLSPDAAQSEWVNQEIEYWKEHKDSSRILPVLTDGTFEWTDGQVTGTAVPEQLQDSFSEEPRWVDMRFAREEEQLDLKNPLFADTVADIASALRGVPKDELASEEVKQHRRTIRTAWAGAALIGLLAIAATAFAFQSADNAQRAEAEAARAEANAEAEAEARGEAESNAELAGQEAERANENAQLATEASQLANARELAASAIGVLDSDPELAVLLALESIAASPEDTEQPVEVINALWQAGSATRLVDVVDVGKDRSVLIDLSDDGSRLLISSKSGPSLTMWDTHDLEQPLWEFSEQTVDAFTFPSLSPDGRLAAVGVLDSASHEAQFDGEGDEADDLPNRVHIVEAASGQLITTLDFPECVGVDVSSFSHDGSKIAIGSGWEGCPREGAESGQWVEVFATETWESLTLHELTGDAFGPRPVFNPDDRLYIFNQDQLQVLDSELESVTVFEQISGFGDVTRDGSKIAAFVWPERNDLILFDGVTGAQLDLLTPWDAFPRRPAGILFSSNSEYLTVGTEGRTTHVFRTITGNRDLSVGGGSADMALVDVSGNRLFTAHPDGAVRVWNLGASSFGIEPAGDLGAATWVNGNSFFVGDVLGGLAPLDFTRFSEDQSVELRFFDVDDGSLTSHRLVARGNASAALGGQRFVYAPEPGYLFVADLQTGDEEYLIGCPGDEDLQFCVDTGDPFPNHLPLVSVDGSELAAIETREPEESSDEEASAEEVSEEIWTIFDPNTLEVVAEETHTGSGLVLAFTDDWIVRDDHDARRTYATDRTTGETLWTVDVSGRTELSPTRDMVAVVEDRGGLTAIDLNTGDSREFSTDLGAWTIRGMGISADATTLALGTDEELLLLDLVSGGITQKIPIPGVSDIYWIDSKTLVIGSKHGVWGRISLDTDDLVASAQRNLLRGFSEDECVTYRIDPCPSLEEMRGR